MSELTVDGTAVQDLNLRLEALAARLDEQASMIREQQEEIARLKLAPSAPVRSSNPASVTSRRKALRGLLAAGAAVTALAAAKAAPAHAGTRTTLFPDNTASYGAAFTYPASRDPTLDLPPLGGFRFGLICSTFNEARAPTLDASICGTASDFVGVYGLSHTKPGVQGESTSGVGVIGRASANIGVYGASTTNVGVYGDAQFNTAVNGRTHTGIGIYGTALDPGGGGRAAVFDGSVQVNGPFTVVGGPKSAGVKHPDGTVRRMYCQESPEPWFEDFGATTLRNGRAEVVLDPDFDALVKGDAYLVFLTEIGDCGGLYVSRKGPHRFEVRSRAGAVADGSFDYRVVARRLDHVGTRLEKVDVRPAQSRDVKPPDFTGPARPAREDRR